MLGEISEDPPQDLGSRGFEELEIELRDLGEILFIHAHASGGAFLGRLPCEPKG